MTLSGSRLFIVAVALGISACQLDLRDSGRIRAVVRTSPETERVSLLIDGEAVSTKPLRRAPQDWVVEIRAKNSKRAEAKGTEVWLADVSTPEQRVEWSPKLFTEGAPWIIRDDPNAPSGKVAIAAAGEPQKLEARLFGSTLTVRLLKHPWSGQVEVVANGVLKSADLYAEAGATETIEFMSSALPDEGSAADQTLVFEDLPTPEDQTVGVRAEPSGALEIVAAEINGKPAVLTGSQTMTWPIGSWVQRHKHPLAVAVLSILSALLIVFGGALAIYPLGQAGGRKVVVSWLGAGVLGLWWTLVSSPGYLSTDSVFQWHQALTGRFNNWHPPIMAMLMRATLAFVNQPVLFTFFQAVLFWFSLFWSLSVLLKNARVWLIVSALVAAHPMLWVYSTTLWKDVWVASMAMVALAFLVRAARDRSVGSLWWGTLFVSLAICFRHNAQTMAAVPVLIALITFRGERMPKKLSRIIALSLVLLVPSRLISRLPMVDAGKPFSSAHLLAPYVFGTLARLDATSSAWQEEKAAVDAEFGAGVSDKAKDNYNCVCGLYLVTGANALGGDDAIYKHAEFIKKEFGHLLRTYPRQMLNHRTCSLEAFMQLNAVYYPLHTGVNENAQRIQARSWWPTIQKGSVTLAAAASRTPLARHFLFDLVLLVALLVGAWKRLAVLVVPALLGLSYLAPFFAVDPCPDWRYQLLNYLMSLACLAVGLEALIARCQRPN